MAPGTCLRIFQHLRRLGIAAEVGTERGIIVIRTAAMTAVYEETEIVLLAQQAPHWTSGQTAEEILW